MSDPTSSPTEGRGGLALLFLFAFATLLVVIGVWALGAIGGWWVLGLAMVIHLAMTAAVIWGLARALSDRAEPTA